MKKFSVLLSLIAGFLLFFQTQQSHAMPISITGVETTVSLTSINDLIDLGLTPAPLGTAAITPGTDPPEIVFPITGGTFFDNVDPAKDYSLIEHNGSGFSLTNSSSTFLNLENFLINTKQSQLSGDASFAGGSVDNLPIFNITPTLSLLLTSQAAGAIDGIFGVGDLTNFEIGKVTDLNVALGAPIPEPSTMALFAIGIVGLAWISIRRKKK
jgi:hypothetical protein